MISKILSQKDELKNNVAANKMRDCKRKHMGNTDDIEKALYTWFADTLYYL